MSLYEEAKEKIEVGSREELGKYGNAMKQAVADALIEFCRQDAEFAQAVVEGGTFKQCMAEVAKHVKDGSISDMEAFGAAVKFYFPGAGIKVSMTIDLCASVTTDKTPESGSIVVDISDYF